MAPGATETPVESPGNRQATLQQVDTLKGQAHALNQSLANKQKGEAEADALINQALIIVDWVSKNPSAVNTSTPLIG